MTRKAVNDLILNEEKKIPDTKPNKDEEKRLHKAAVELIKTPTYKARNLLHYASVNHIPAGDGNLTKSALSSSARSQSQKPRQ